MILSFDKFERYELPQVTLCNPNSRATEVDGKIIITDTVGVLSNPKGMNLKLNFNAPHELSFDYYRHKSTDPIKQSFYDSIYESIQTDRYIYLTDIGYFIISSVTDSDEDNIDKKSITLKSCEENEFATAEGLHLKEGTYYLHTDNNDGLLDLFLPKTVGWTMGYIDPSLLTKPYYVEDTEVDNGYNFLYTTIQDMFECIVEPDIIKRTVSVYSRAYYTENHLTDIHLAKHNLLKYKVVEENDEDKFTALNVQGKDESLEIRTVNPTGKNVIYNFEPRYSWMSPALQTAVTKWQEKCESVEEEYLTLQQGYYDDMGNIVFPLEKDIETLELQLKEQEQTRDFIVRDDYDKKKYGEVQKDALDAINREIKTTQSQLKSKKEDLEVEKKNVQNNYLQHIDQINLDCALDITAIDINGNSIFTTDLLNELMTHIKPTDYVDEYMLVTESMTYPQKFEKAKELMDRAQSQLVKISSGQKTYSVDTRSFLFNKQFRHFSEQLCAGAIIYVETKNDTMEQLHLTGIDINFDEKTTSFTLGNKYDRSDLKALYDDALGQNSKSFSELKYIASIIEDQQKQLDYQRNWVADLRTLTLDNVLTSEDQAIEINNRGLIGRKRQLNSDGSWKFDENGNPLFELEQVKLINNTLVFTENDWDTASTAVGKIAVGYNADGSVKYSYGINGQVLIGELILGNNLVLTGTGAGIKITDSNGNKVFYADNDGNLTLYGNIFANTGKIGNLILSNNKLFSTANAYDSNVSGLNGFFHTASNNTIFLWAGAHGGYGVPESNTVETFGSYDWTNARSIIEKTANFYVTHSGELYATGATIAGTITAASGKIGGWEISSWCLKSTTSQWEVIVRPPARYGNSGGDTDVIVVHDLVESTYPFVVKSDGTLRCTKAEIIGYVNATSGSFTGAITATSGKIANWTIDGDSITAWSSGDDKVFLHKPSAWGDEVASGGNKDVLVVRSKGTYPFVLLSDGTLTATKATITGTINAGSGKIGGWTISGSTLMVGNMSQETEVIIDPNYLRAHGDSAYWWDVVMCTQAWTTQWSSESDFNVKNTISEYDLKYEILFDALKPCRYKYNHGTSDRFHTGFIAQEVVEAIEGANLTTQDFAGVVHLEKPNKNNCEWLLRRDEFVALNTWQIQKAKARITELENTVAELKTQILTLSAG